ncbi:TetR/AcrR family transcriptional regulator [Marinobacter sp. C2H3]|uniref:TetR/AcrR family transcriptional regulator n=1 Tax=Marinobacter sp. C2H3 TaxID=3119003 RepID=UPI00300EBF52
MTSAVSIKAMTPRGRERAERILAAATAVFLEQGYGAATMGEIGRRAGGSMQTLYRLFGSKEGLFQAIMAQKGATVYGQMEDPAIYEKPPEQALFELGIRLNELILNPETLATHRIVMLEGPHHPELQRIFHDSGPGRTRQVLARYFAAECQRGRLRLANVDAAAGQFLDMVKGAYFLPAILGRLDASTEIDIPGSVRQAVDIFLYGALTR